MDESDVVEAEVLPAYAGMIRRGPIARASEEGAPRVCGDDPSLKRNSESSYRCSPRMRG